MTSGFFFLNTNSHTYIYIKRTQHIPKGTNHIYTSFAVQGYWFGRLALLRTTKSLSQRTSLVSVLQNLMEHLINKKEIEKTHSVDPYANTNRNNKKKKQNGNEN